MTPEKAKELVFCIPKHAYGVLGDINGCFLLPTAQAPIYSTSGTYLPRGVCEDNPFFKQPIAQILLVCRDRIAIHSIPNTGGDPRLHGQGTFFFGGHMEPKDDGNSWATAEREVIEETGLKKGDFELEWLGYVNMNNTMLSAVHFGIVFAAHISNEFAFASCVKHLADDGVKDIKLVPWAEVAPYLPSMTAWARVAFPVLAEHFATRRPYEFKDPTAPLPLG